MSIIKTPPIQGTAPAIQSAFLRQFNGGINYRDDGLQIPPNQLVDCVDVDLTVGGGIARRAAIIGSGAQGSNPANAMAWIFHATKDTNNGNILTGGTTVGGADTVWKTAAFAQGGTPVSAGTFTTPSTLNQTWSAAWMRRASDGGAVNNLYIHRDRLAPVQAYLNSDNLLHAELTDAYGNYNDNYNTVVGGTNPHASICVAHHNFLFHADCTENSIRYGHRVRFSHPQEPGDYATNDFIDVGIGMDDNDAITAMISAFGSLFVFKRKSVWMITGYSNTTFAVNRIATGIGCPNKNCATSSQYGVFFYDGQMGVHQMTYRRGASGRVWMAEPLWPLINPRIWDGTITDGLQGPSLTLVGTKLYVSGIQYSGVNSTFILDILLGKASAAVGGGGWEGWTRYGVGFDLIAPYTPVTGKPLLMGVGANGNKDRLGIQGFTPTTYQDTLDGVTSTGYTGSFQTSWITGGDPNRKKRFRRCALVFDDMPTNKSFTLTAYKNWALTNGRVFTLSGGGGLFTDDKAVRGGTVGTGYSVGYVITGRNDGPWVVNQVTQRYVPLRIN